MEAPPPCVRVRARMFVCVWDFCERPADWGPALTPPPPPALAALAAPRQGEHVTRSGASGELSGPLPRPRRSLIDLSPSLEHTHGFMQLKLSFLRISRVHPVDPSLPESADVVFPWEFLKRPASPSVLSARSGQFVAWFFFFIPLTCVAGWMYDMGVEGYHELKCVLVTSGWMLTHPGGRYTFIE